MDKKEEQAATVGQPSNPQEDTKKDENSDFKDLLNNLSTILKRTTASNRSIPSWDSSSSKHGVSIKSHIKLFENLAKRMGWSDDEKALELLLTLKGQSRKYVESLSTEVTQNFGKLKEDLIKTYTRRKPEAQRLREWNASRWDTGKQTLTEFAAMLTAKLKKLNEDDIDHPDTDLFLKNRFIEAIKDENPEFGRYLDLNRPEKSDFQELVTFCQSKYDIFCAVEKEDEERKESEIFFNKSETDNSNTHHFNPMSQQMPYPFFFPYPFMYPESFQNKPRDQHRTNYQRFTKQTSNTGGRQFGTYRQVRQEGRSRYNNASANKEKERSATKVPKDHKIEYIKDSKKNNQKNL